MNALFLAGGLGTRLKPMTDHMPKPMVPIMGRPLLERSLEELKLCGADEIVLSTCYKSDYIQHYFGTGDKLGMNIHYVCEDIPLGTGGAIKKSQKYFNDTFLIFNSDILTNIDLKKLLEFHKNKKADVTIAATRVPNPSSYGVIEYDSEGYATTFTEKPKPGEEKSNEINAGIYVFESEILDEIPDGRVVSIEKDIFPKLLKKGCKIAVYRGGDYWMDIGTPEKYMEAHRDIFEGRCCVSENDFPKSGIYGRSNARMHGTARVLGPVWFGRNVTIGANVTIGPNVVAGNNFQAGRGCTIANSIIWDNVTIGSGVSIVDSVVTSGCHVGSGVQCLSTVYSPESKRPFAI